MRTFKEWLREMAGTGAVWDGTRSPDFQWWGAPRPAARRRKRRRGK